MEKAKLKLVSEKANFIGYVDVSKVYGSGTLRYKGKLYNYSRYDSTDMTWVYVEVTEPTDIDDCFSLVN